MKPCEVFDVDSGKLGKENQRRHPHLTVAFLAISPIFFLKTITITIKTSLITIAYDVGTTCITNTFFRLRNALIAAIITNLIVKVSFRPNFLA